MHTHANPPLPVLSEKEYYHAYTALDLSPDATDEQIKAKIAFLKNGSLLTEIKTAIEILETAEGRQLYKQEVEEGKKFFSFVQQYAAKEDWRGLIGEINKQTKLFSEKQKKLSGLQKSIFITTYVKILPVLIHYNKYAFTRAAAFSAQSPTEEPKETKEVKEVEVKEANDLPKASLPVAPSSSLKIYSRLTKKFGKNMQVQNDTEAYAALLEAAKDSDHVALCNLGYWHIQGRHVSKDLDKAIEYFKKAEILWDCEALLGLAEAYTQKGEIDKAKAYKETYAKTIAARKVQAENFKKASEEFAEEFSEERSKELSEGLAEELKEKQKKHSEYSLWNTTVGTMLAAECEKEIKELLSSSPQSNPNTPSTSITAPLGSAATPIEERAGNGTVKNSPITSLTAGS